MPTYLVVDHNVTYGKSLGLFTASDEQAVLDEVARADGHAGYQEARAANAEKYAGLRATDVERFVEMLRDEGLPEEQLRALFQPR